MYIGSTRGIRRCTKYLPEGDDVIRNLEEALSDFTTFQIAAHRHRADLSSDPEYIYTWPHTLEYIHTLATRRPYALVYFHTFPSLLFLFKTSLEKKKTPKQTQRCRSNPQECPTRWRSTCTSTRGRSTISSCSITANTVQSSIRF